MLPGTFIGIHAEVYTPVDGNCMYNALSLHLLGDILMTSELSCRIMYETIANNEYCDALSQPCQLYDPLHWNTFMVSAAIRIIVIREIAAASNVLVVQTEMVMQREMVMHAGVYSAKRHTYYSYSNYWWKDYNM